jgi:hypothetical protein
MGYGLGVGALRKLGWHPGSGLRCGDLEPYFPLWSSISVTRGYLGVIAVEHDRTSRKVRRIVKGTSGRALL